MTEKEFSQEAQELSEAVKPSDPELTAVENFDKGLDEVVSGLRRMEDATIKLREHHPGIEKLAESVQEGLLPWVAKVDDDFTTLFPDMDDEK